MGLKLKFGESVSRIDAGIYIAMIKGVSAKTHKENGSYLNWLLAISGATKDGEACTGNVVLGVNTSSEWTDSPKNKLNKLLKAAGVIIGIGEELDVDMVIGKKLQVVVEDNDTEQGMYSKITSFMPLKKRAAPVVQQPVEEVAEEVVEEAPAPVVVAPKPVAKVAPKPAAAAPKPVVKAAPKPAPQPVAAVEEPEAEAPAEEAAVSEEDLFNFS